MAKYGKRILCIGLGSKCTTLLYSYESLALHFNDNHSDEGFVCLNCARGSHACMKYFSTKKLYKEHKNKCKEKTQCRGCKKYFVRAHKCKKEMSSESEGDSEEDLVAEVVEAEDSVRKDEEEEVEKEEEEVEKEEEEVEKEEEEDVEEKEVEEEEEEDVEEEDVEEELSRRNSSIRLEYSLEDMTVEAFEESISENEDVDILFTEIQDSVSKDEDVDIISDTAEMRILREENRTFKADNIRLREELVAANTVITDLEAEKIRDQKEFEADNIRLREELVAANTVITDLKAEKIRDQKEFEVRVLQSDALRRQLENTIQDLKGNLRVFCRIRPIIPSDNMPTGNIAHLNILHDKKSLEVKNLCAHMDRLNTPTSRQRPSITFTFDGVFGPEMSQKHIFDELTDPIRSVFSGKNVCIFAYGQTGSGKTFTMQGGTTGAESDGIIPRSVDFIFSECRALKAGGWEHSIHFSYFEVYNEEIRDLLGPPGGDHVIHIINKETEITNLKVTEIHNKNDLDTLLVKAYKRRAVAPTRCNAASSRSHSVLRLQITGINAVTNEKSSGNVWLVDLAGSEKNKDSQATGLTFQEAKKINHSLLTLGMVIRAIVDKALFIPYRGSVLTELLQLTLGGTGCKTLMFANISPQETAAETIKTCEFAFQASQVAPGRADQSKPQRPKTPLHCPRH